MIRATPAALALVVVAGVAGCLGTDETPGDPSGTGSAGPQPAADASLPTPANGTPPPRTLRYRDCHLQAGAFPVPASAYEDRLPPGFSAARPAFLPADPAGAAGSVFVGGIACRDGDLGPVSEVTAYLGVDPPDAWTHPDADLHGIPLAMITTSERVTAARTGWGFGAVAATGGVTLETRASPATLDGAVTAHVGDRRLEMTTAVDGEPDEMEGGLARWFGVSEEGTVVGAIDHTWSEAPGRSGTAEMHGSPELGALEAVPSQPGLGFHKDGMDLVDRPIDLPPREGS